MTVVSFHHSSPAALMPSTSPALVAKMLVVQKRARTRMAPATANSARSAVDDGLLSDGAFNMRNIQNASINSAAPRPSVTGVSHTCLSGARPGRQTPTTPRTAHTTPTPTSVHAALRRSRRRRPALARRRTYAHTPSTPAHTTSDVNTVTNRTPALFVT